MIWTGLLKGWDVVVDTGVHAAALPAPSAPPLHLVSQCRLLRHAQAPHALSSLRRLVWGLSAEAALNKDDLDAVSLRYGCRR